VELYIIRHGQSVNNAYWDKEGFQDLPDPELTEVGKRQAKTLAEFLGENQERNEIPKWNSQNQHGFGLTHIYTSLMVRAASTATPIAESLGLPLVAWPEIHETGGIFSRTDGGLRAGLPGKPRSYFEKHYPGFSLPDELDEKGWWNRPFEEREARRPRSERVWAELLERHGDKPGEPESRVAIVSHGGFFNYLLTSALGVHLKKLDERRNAFWMLMNNCAISHLDLVDRQVRVAYINRHEYLPDNLIT